MTRIKPIYKIAIGLIAVAALFVALHDVVSVDNIFETGGIIGLALTIFAETGLLAGFFLPGDTLLFAAGFFAAQDRLDLWATVIALFSAAVIGNMVGYEIGKRSGHKLFKNTDSIFFNKENIDKAQEFFKVHGGKTIILARFVPIVRTLSSPLAGMGHMDYTKFMIYNVVGALLWVPTLVFLGYWIGRTVGEFVNIDKYILPIALLAMLVTFGGSFAHVLRDPVSRQKIITKLKASF